MLKSTTWSMTRSKSMFDDNVASYCIFWRHCLLNLQVLSLHAYVHRAAMKNCHHYQCRSVHTSTYRLSLSTWLPELLDFLLEALPFSHAFLHQVEVGQNGRGGAAAACPPLAPGEGECDANTWTSGGVSSDVWVTQTTCYVVAMFFLSKVHMGKDSFGL